MRPAGVLQYLTVGITGTGWHCPAGGVKAGRCQTAGSTRGLTRRSTRIPTSGPTRRAGAGRQAHRMNTTMYLINGMLVLLVVRQIREHRLDLAGLAVPVLAVGAAAAGF